MVKAVFEFGRDHALLSLSTNSSVNSLQGLCPYDRDNIVL